MKTKQTFLKLAIAFIGITACVLLVICIKNWLSGQPQWTLLITFLVELSLLQSLIADYLKKK